jgi:hypothetical protein
MASAPVALGLALLALALAYAGAQHKNTHLFVLALPPGVSGARPPPVRHSLARTDARLASLDTCIAGEPWPPPHAATANHSLAHTRLPPLHARLTRQERILTEFFSALLSADDLELIERGANASGLAYLDIDANYSMCRPPLLLRGGVREIMRKYRMPVIPAAHKWAPVERVQDGE